MYTAVKALAKSHSIVDEIMKTHQFIRVIERCDDA